MGKNQWWVGNLDRLRNDPLLCNVGRGGGAGRAPPFEDERADRHFWGAIAAAGERPASVCLILSPSDDGRVRSPLDNEDRSAHEAASEAGRQSGSRRKWVVREKMISSPWSFSGMVVPIHHLENH